MGIFAMWSDRYFVLERGTLSWYENKEKYLSSGSPQNSTEATSIQKIEIVPDDDKKLNLVTIGRVYILEAPSGQARDDWMQALDKARQMADECLHQVDDGAGAEAVFHTTYKLHQIQVDGKIKQRELSFDEFDGVECSRQTLRFAHPREDIRGIVRDKSNSLRFHLEVVSRYHFEAATVAQLGEIEMSCKVMTGELKKPAGHKANKPSRKVSLLDFEILQRIGEGAQAAVALVRHKRTKEMFAMKTFKLDRMSKETLEQTKREKDVLSHVRHPFLCQMYYSFVQENKICLVLELANGGELFLQLQRQPYKRFDFSTACFYIAEVISGMGYLHDQDIIYRDLKPENLLIADDGHIKIADFGLARDSITARAGAVDGEPAKSIVGTPEYFAPEILKMVPYGKSCDWWTVGVLMFELVTGRSPFHQDSSASQPAMFAKIRDGGAKSKIFQGAVAKKIDYPPEAKDLILRFLDPNPETRIGTVGGVQEIMDHPFFTEWAPKAIPGFSWEKLNNKDIAPPWLPQNMNIKANVDQQAQRSLGTFAHTHEVRGKPVMDKAELEQAFTFER